MAGITKQILARPIQLADHLTKIADDAVTFRQECSELKTKAERLASLLRQAARSSSDLYDRPALRIMDEAEQSLDKALDLVLKCRSNSFVKRLFTIIPTASFRKMSSHLENSIGDVSWLLRVSLPPSSAAAAAGDDDDHDDYLGLPPIAANDPILCLIWEQVGILLSGDLQSRSDAAASLVSLARDNDRYGRLILQEGAVPPLLRLAKEGLPEAQENAARAVGLLGRDPDSVEQIVNSGVASIFAKILKDGEMRVQAVVSWAVSELAEHHPKCQDHFLQSNIIRMIVGHLAFETIQEHSKYAVSSRQDLSLHSVFMASKATDPSRVQHSQVMYPGGGGGGGGGQIQSVVSDSIQHERDGGERRRSVKGVGRREAEDEETKAGMKAMAARALWMLCRGNKAICRSITESRALLCFAVLLEKGGEEVRYNCAMAVMEISRVAEENADLRRSAFKPNSPTAKAILEQMVRRMREEGGERELVVACVRSVGNLARTLRRRESRGVIGAMVRLMEEEREVEVMVEAVVALSKFACGENYLHVGHCREVIEEGGVKHLIQLVFLGERVVQSPALVLLCYLTLHVPDSEELGKEVMNVLEWASKQAHLVDGNPLVQSLLPEAKARLELYQSRVSTAPFY